MLILHDPACATYEVPGHVEAPFRVLKTAEHLLARHPQWNFAEPGSDAEMLADDKPLLRAHTAKHLAALRNPKGDFDADCPAIPDIDLHARRAAYAAIRAAETALDGDKVFSLMRPPGHHATRDKAMGFCYLNSIAIAALHASKEMDVERVAVWDFDAHHGNGTEAILAKKKGFLYVSVHQSPGYPDTGLASAGNARNYPVAPGTPAEKHMEILEASWTEVLEFQPDLVLVSAGFDAYAGDPITEMSLQVEDFAKLGHMLGDAPCPMGAILEGGYSQELPLLVDSFLSAWQDA